MTSRSGNVRIRCILNKIHRLLACVALACLLMMFTGCSSAPRTRLGALPFPGLLTLYTQADPNDLGVARYERWPRLFREDERSRGIMYTQRAGFLDLAHVREAMDWSWYASRRVATALENRRTKMYLDGYDDCPFHITFRYPDDWDCLEGEERERVISELSCRIGERIAFNAMTWHEIITWFDYRTTLIVPEKGSSFTYEDTISHMIGIAAADDALHHETGSWDRDATIALRRELETLEVVSMEEETAAVRAVEGNWWKDGLCLRRNIDIGNKDGEIHPWLVRDIHEREPSPEVFCLPSLSDVLGRDYSGLWQMQIEPSLLIPSKAVQFSRLSTHFIDPETDFPAIMEQIRREMKSELGPHADRPYDDGRWAQDDLGGSETAIPRDRMR